MLIGSRSRRNQSHGRLQVNDSRHVYVTATTNYTKITERQSMLLSLRYHDSLQKTCQQNIDYLFDKIRVRINHGLVE
ncbi:uncharacterized [Tachysurus ichikawai]